MSVPISLDELERLKLAAFMEGHRQGVAEERARVAPVVAWLESHARAAHDRIAMHLRLSERTEAAIAKANLEELEAHLFILRADHLTTPGASGKGEK